MTLAAAVMADSARFKFSLMGLVSLVIPLLYPIGIFWCSLNTWRFVWFWRLVTAAGWVISAMWLVVAALVIGGSPSMAVIALYGSALLWLVPALIVLSVQVFRRAS